MDGVDDIDGVDELAQYEAERRLRNDRLPTIRLIAGEIERAVDETEDALLRAGRGLYQRANLIVSVCRSPALASHGREVSILRIAERGDHALLEDIAASARFEKFDKREKDYVLKDPPMDLAKTLKQRMGRLRLPVLTGIVNAPTLRADGSILDKPGYDAETGILFEPLGVDFGRIDRSPSYRAVQEALGTLISLIETFPFVGDADRSVALSAILTACIRRSLPTAPAHAFTAPVAGSGKSKLVDIASVIAFGHEAAVMAQGQTEEEMEKRLGAVLLSGDGAVSLDNCERPVAGELLCQMLTQTMVRPRILGKSEAPWLSTNLFVAATGNNLSIAGDMTRRAILCRLDPKVERPENREFEWEPVTIAKERRSEFVAAALTILRAYHVAGSPNLPQRLGSFEQWSDRVRGALIWAGCADPVATMQELRKSDPKLADLQAVVSQWDEHIGSQSVTVAEVIRLAIEMTAANGYERPDFVRAELREALMSVAGQGGIINTRRLGKWLSSVTGRVVDGKKFEDMGPRHGVTVWALKEC